MKITDILETQENTNPLYVANRDFEVVPDTDYKGYVMGDNSIDDDDGFVKLGFAVYKFAKNTEFSMGSSKHQQKHYQYVRDIVDPRTGRSPSPYGRLGTFTDKDLDLFRITDVNQREQKLGKKIDYEDMYRYTVDALEDGSLTPHIIPRVNENLERGVSAAQLADRFGADVAQDIARQKGNAVLFTKDLNGQNWKIIKHSDGTIRIERDYMLEGDVIMFEGNGKALVGTIVKMDDDTLVIEGGTFPLNEEEIAEGVGKWVGAAALAGLLGLGANQLLDPGAAERTPLGRAMAAAAAKGDTYAAKELKKLGLYMDVGAYDQLAGLKDTYLDVPAGQKYKVKEALRSDDLLTDPLGDDMDRNELLKILNSRMIDLDTRQKEAIRMWLDGETYNEIGKKLGNLSGSRARQILLRGIWSLQSYMRKERPEFQHLEVEINGADFMRRAKRTWHLLTNIERKAIVDAFVQTGYSKSRYDTPNFISAWKKMYKHIDPPSPTNFYFKIAYPLKRSKEWPDADLIGQLDEAEYHGRKVKLGKPIAGDVKKYKVYVKDPKTGNIKKVNFGDKGMEIKRDDPKRRKNFRARHGCGTPRASNRTKAAYWSCRMWSKKPVGQILKGK